MSETSTTRYALRGIPYDALSEQEVVDHIIERARAGQGGRVVTPNVDILRQASSSDELGRLVTSADLVLADGMPIVWALHLAGTPVPERVAGSALGPKLAAAAAQQGIGFFLLGGGPGVAEAAAIHLQRQYPDLRIGWHYPPMGFEDDEGQRAAIDDAIDRFGPSICLCGLGFPKQDRLGAELLERFPDSWFLGAGATIAFLAGDVARAPIWMQRLGLEWMHRLVLEPRRLADRYLRLDAPFAVRLLVDAAVVGFRKGKA